MKITEVKLLEVLSHFPEINKLDDSNPILKKKYDFFLSALGFEERTLAIPRMLSATKTVIFSETIYFQYETSTIENAYNEPKLIEYFSVISKHYHKLFCDEPSFIDLLRERIIKRKSEKDDQLEVMLDISVCSSKLILSIVKVLLNLDIKLVLVYTEAKLYYPEYSEYLIDPDIFKEKNTVRDETVVLSPEYSGGNKANPDLIISFPNFKAQRVKNIISVIDETVLLKPDDRLIWIVGEPNTNLEDATKRKQMMMFLNEIQENAKIYEVSTLNYKKTIEKLEHIYQEYNLDCHINIADLGSKMQTLAIAIFCLIRPEISIYHTLPSAYKPSKYSQGVKDFWSIDFGKTSSILDRINEVDSIQFYD